MNATDRRIREITFRQVDDAKWEASVTMTDGTTTAWVGELPPGDIAPAFDWERPPRELPWTKPYREFAPGLDLFLTAKLHLRNPEQRHE